MTGGLLRLIPKAAVRNRAVPEAGARGPQGAIRPRMLTQPRDMTRLLNLAQPGNRPTDHHLGRRSHPKEKDGFTHAAVVVRPFACGWAFWWS